MQRGRDSHKYIRTRDCVWGLTYKVGSTSLLRWLPEPRQYTGLRPGDHVRLLVRDPRDRLVSAYMWFTKRTNSPIPDIPAPDQQFLLDQRAEFIPWARTALRHWNPHWAPQTEIHPRWREFELIRLTDFSSMGGPQDKKTRQDNSWEQYYDDALLDTVNAVYAEDIEMWKEVTNGTDTRSRRVL